MKIYTASLIVTKTLSAPNLFYEARGQKIPSGALLKTLRWTLSSIGGAIAENPIVTWGFEGTPIHQSTNVNFGSWLDFRNDYEEANAPKLLEPVTPYVKLQRQQGATQALSIIISLNAVAWTN